MSYRNRAVATTPVMCDVASASAIHVLNGVSAEFAIPCLYVIPSETSGESELVPIRLRQEGYGEPVVAIEDPPQGLTSIAWVDAADDSIIRFVISAQCPAAIEDDIETRISVLITRPTTNRGNRTDAVMRGTLEIKASPLPGITPGVLLPHEPVAPATQITLDTATFNGILNSHDVTVQSAMSKLDDILPAGIVSAFAGNTIPGGWLLCDGAAISRIEFSRLFAAIGTMYGAGDHTTTFNVPNVRSRVITGLGDDAEFNTIGKTGGVTRHQLTIGELPAHTHGLLAQFTTVAGVMTQATAPIYLGGEANRADRVISNGIAQSTGSNQSHTNLAPYIVMHYMIKI